LEILTFDGDLDIALRDVVRAQIDQTEGRGGDIGLDLSGVPYMDTTIIALFVRLKNELASQGRSVRVLATSPQVRKILTLAGLADFFALNGEHAVGERSP
jgi:anti-anti-sigma factor